MSIKLMLFGLGAVAIATVVGTGYLHYQSILRDRDAALADRDRLTLENAELAEGMDLYRRQAEAASEAMVDMADAADAANDEVERLNALFREHDFGRLTKAKPGQLERRINRGTDRILELFEQATATDASGGGTAAPDRPSAP